MSRPPVIALQRDERRAVANLSLSQDAEFFRGHFPDTPVLPGVVQIDWVMRLAEECFHISPPTGQDFQVKFSRVIGPDMALVLILEIDPARQRLLFEYRVDDQVMSSGRVKIETPP